MNINTVKRAFASIRSIINLTMREHGIEDSNAFSGTFMPYRGDDRQGNATVMAKAELAVTCAFSP